MRILNECFSESFDHVSVDNIFNICLIQFIDSVCMNVWTHIASLFIVVRRKLHIFLRKLIVWWVWIQFEFLQHRTWSRYSILEMCSMFRKWNHIDNYVEHLTKQPREFLSIFRSINSPLEFKEFHFATFSLFTWKIKSIFLSIRVKTL